MFELAEGSNYSILAMVSWLTCIHQRLPLRSKFAKSPPVPGDDTSEPVNEAQPVIWAWGLPVAFFPAPLQISKFVR
jgi:hypothetical protein